MTQIKKQSKIDIKNAELEYKSRMRIENQIKQMDDLRNRKIMSNRMLCEKLGKLYVLQIFFENLFNKTNSGDQ